VFHTLSKTETKCIKLLQVEYGQFYITLEGTGTDEYCYEAFDVIPREGYRATDVKLSVINPGRLDYDNGTCNDVTIKVCLRHIFLPSQGGKFRDATSRM
jgi:hypothetical protein